MDKNTITGLVLIAILLVGFSFLSRPSKEQLAAQQRYYDSIAQVQQREADLKAKAEAALANDKEEQTAGNRLTGYNTKQSGRADSCHQGRTYFVSYVERVYGTGQKDTCYPIQRQRRFHELPFLQQEGNHTDGELLFFGGEPYGQHRNHAFGGRQRQLYRL